MRLVPAAVTPVSLRDIIRAVVASKGALPIFRRKIARYCDGRSSYTFTSLMRATYACLHAISLTRPGRNEVILPRYSCPSFVHGVLAAGLTVRYCDIDPRTLSISLPSLASVVSDKTVVVLVANLFGLASPIDAIVELCRRHKVLVVEGVDYALGSSYASKKVGAFGDFAILNFQEGKALPIGGAAVVERKTAMMQSYEDSERKGSSIPRIMLMTAYAVFSRPFFYYLLNSVLQFVGISRKQLSMEDTIRNTSREYDYAFKVKRLPALSDFQAALGLQLLSQFTRHKKIRAQNALELARHISSKLVTKITREPGLTDIHPIRYPVLVDCDASVLCDKMLSAGIEASRMYIEHGMDIVQADFPGAYQVAQTLVTLPCHPYVTEQDVIRMSRVIKEHVCI